ncbi:prepilin-type N-terminal cleavage/methylation domain-containing protein [Elusimicrobium posterum]|uniref:type IV pilin protein n=1 Tax=Elusimicrobium posterum TaxID=3116653 RepID=UPI003C774B3F
MKKGFTLIELLVVVLIIGILASIALPQYTKAVEKSRTSEAVLMLKNITDAANRFYLANGSYLNSDGTAISLDDLDLEFPNHLTTSSFSTKNFIYNLRQYSKNNFGVSAQKGNMSTDSNAYSIVYDSANGALTSRGCWDGSKTGKICKGLMAGANCVTGLSDTSCSF